MEEKWCERENLADARRGRRVQRRPRHLTQSGGGVAQLSQARAHRHPESLTHTQTHTEERERERERESTPGESERLQR
jgi:hypothetical protein